MKLVYIASPYTLGDVAQNVRIQFQAAEELKEAGFLPFPPLFSHFWHFMNPHPWEYWMEMDREWVQKADCILRLPGASKGADEEVALATKLNIPVFYSVQEVIQNG